ASWSPARRARTGASWRWPPRLSERFPTIDPALARRRFSRAAASYPQASRLEIEVGARLLERLDYVKLAPRRILDAGSGPAPEGLVLFSSLGPDTLKELRAAAGAASVHEFVDMHDLGDMLVAAGFSAPVMDMEVLAIEYAAGGRLLEDLRASGQTNARIDRPR